MYFKLVIELYLTLQQEDSTTPAAAEEEGSIEIAVAAHYLDPPLSVTPQLEELISSLPAWVSAVGWTSVYSSWVF